MPPGGSADDIGVNPCDYRVGDIHLRGHLIARFACMEKVSLFHCVSLGTFQGDCNCADRVSYTVEGQMT